jgi:hypothetical protein
MAKALYTGIAFYPKNDNKLPLKYRNINNPASLCLKLKIKGIHYINFYDKITKEYKFRLYCENQFKPLKLDNGGQIFNDRYLTLKNTINSRKKE